MPPLCSYRLSWSKRTSWEWWDEWGDTVLQTQGIRALAGGLRPTTLPLGHGGSPQYSIFASERGRNIFFKCQSKERARDLWLSKQAALTLHQSHHFPSKHKTLCNIFTTSAQRLRRWSNIVEMLYKCFVFAGLLSNALPGDIQMYTKHWTYSGLMFDQRHWRWSNIKPG